jgi:hypothetical protein
VGRHAVEGEQLVGRKAQGDAQLDRLGARAQITVGQPVVEAGMRRAAEDQFTRQAGVSAFQAG